MLRPTLKGICTTAGIRGKAVCKVNRFVDASGICYGNQAHPEMISLPDPWAEDESFQQPAAPVGGVLAQFVQIENINVITPSISGQSLNMFLIKNSPYINVQTHVN